MKERAARENKEREEHFSLVTLARVLSTNNSYTNPGGAWKYEIWHLWTWKGVDKVRNNATSTLTAANSESVCGLTGLLDEWDYLLAGKFAKNGEIEITSCDLYMAWYDVSAEERNLLSDLRDEAEKCKRYDHEPTAAISRIRVVKNF
ncbi:hypothetical protein ANCCAN_17077 [Ancylostoma caninum]|uniref:NTR domain-containing protein n=1 Tax=Ancylostoma caninum TaxID=29170 RepID=A0A368G355_ANCCA|nr:hypothetical protein ANCCAN_17077 [Ancylostoma caninum]